MILFKLDLFNRVGFYHVLVSAMHAVCYTNAATSGITSF